MRDFVIIWATILSIMALSISQVEKADRSAELKFRHQNVSSRSLGNNA